MGSSASANTSRVAPLTHWLAFNPSSSTLIPSRHNLNSIVEASRHFISGVTIHSTLVPVPHPRPLEAPWEHCACTLFCLILIPWAEFPLLCDNHSVAFTLYLCIASTLFFQHHTMVLPSVMVYEASFKLFSIHQASQKARTASGFPYTHLFATMLPI